MTKTHWVLLAGLFLISWPGAAQTSAIDSLRRHLATLPADTNRVNALDELCWQLSNSDLPQAMAYGKQGLALAERLHFRRGQLKCLNDLGNCASYANDFPAGTRYFLAALRLARQPPMDLRIMGFAYNGLANLNIPQKEYAQAQQNLEQALALTRRTGSVADRTLFESSLGNVLRLRGHYDSAGYYLRSSLALSDSLGNKLVHLNCLNNLAQLAYDQHRPTSARQYIGQALAASRALGHDYYLGVNLSLLSAIELDAGRLPQATAAAQQALAYAQRTGNADIMAECYQTLASIKARQNDFRGAYQWYRQYKTTWDSLTSIEKNAEIAALRVRFDTEQKESRIRALTQQTQVQQLRAEQQQSRLLALLFGLMAVGLAGAGTLVYLAQRRRLARVLREERLRSRIAADLHDEVGTMLTRISLQAEMLRQSQPEASPALDRLLGNSRAAARTMRDIVWSIDAHADTMGALLDRMRDHLDQTATPAGLLTELTATNLRDEEPLAPELRQHLYLVFKEAVTNAVRHARHATALRVSLARHAGQLELRVEDDGQPAPTTTRSGMGLRNMQQRAEALSGQIEAGPDAEKGGFRVRLVVPG
jgi:signal transduction histidine kinase